MLESHKMIDFDSHIPYYFQLIEVIKEKINQGEWKPGDQIPSEPELCEIYGISRTVVRQALKEMEYEGLIYRRKGKGTFIAEPKIGESLVQKLTGFYQDMVDRGHKPITQVLRQEVEPANAQVARHLGLETGTSVFTLERLRFVEDIPIVLVITYLPYELVSKLADYEFSDKSLYAVLENDLGLVLSHGHRWIEAVAANEREAELLQVDECAPLVLLDSVTYLEDGTPIEYYHAVHRGDRSRFEVELVRMREQKELQEAIESNGIKLPNSN